MSITTTILLLIYISFDSMHSSCTISSISLPNQHILQSAYISSQNTAYTFGSYASTNPNLYKYDLSSSQGFIQIGTIPTDAFYSYANGVAIIDNLVYFIGVDRNMNNVHIFDTNTDSWLNNNNIASPQTSAIDACVANNKTHIFSVGGGLDALQIYDITTNTWTQSTINIAAISGKRYWGQMCSMVNNVLYVFGGSVGSGWHTAVNNIYKWQQDTGWISVGALPQIITTVRAETLANNIFIIGGFPTISDKIYEFNIDTEAITNTYHLVNAIDDFAADFVGDTLYVWGSRFYPTEIQICTSLGSFANASKMLTTMNIASSTSSWYTSQSPQVSSITTDSTIDLTTDNKHSYDYKQTITIVIIVAVGIIFILVAITAYSLVQKRKRKYTSYDSVKDKKDQVKMIENDAMNKTMELSMLCSKELELNIEQHEYELEDGTKKIQVQLSVEPKKQNDDVARAQSIPGKMSTSTMSCVTPKGAWMENKDIPREGPKDKFCSLCAGVINGNGMKSNDLLYCALCWANEDRSLSDENERLYTGTNPEEEGEYLTTTIGEDENVTTSGYIN